MLEPFGQLNSRLDDAFVTVLRDVAPSSALSKHSEIFLSHKQPMLGQLWQLVFQVVHRFRAWNVIGHITLPQYNRSSRDRYSKYYDAELRELVRTRFTAEIERFGYTFEEQ
jgi:hypothetical protein